MRLFGIGEVSPASLLSASIGLTAWATTKLVAAPAGAVHGVTALAARVPALVGETIGTARPVRAYDGRIHVGLRNPHSITPERAAAIEKALAAHPGVAWARVNVPLGRVIIAVRAPAPDPRELTALLDGLDPHRPEGDEPTGGPPAALMLAADSLGLVVTVAEWAVRRAFLPVEFAAMLSFVDVSPRLRALVERKVPTAWLPLLTTTAQTLGPGGAGLLADVAQRAFEWREARALDAAWRARERDLCGTPDRAGAPRLADGRGTPLPPGPVERYGDQALGGAALGGLGGVLATRSARRGLDAGLTALPKAATAARAGFAAELTTLLARRGVVVTDPGALRRLDRLDTLVIDMAVLLSDELAIGQVIPLPGAGHAEVATHVYGMFDPRTEPMHWEHGDWVLGEIDGLTLRGARGARERARLDPRFTLRVLGLAHKGRLRAVVSVVRRHADQAHALAVAARRTGLRVVLAGAEGPRPEAWLPRGDLVPGGERLAESVRALQHDGAGVLLLSGDAAALAAADCGVGLGDGPPPWGAHVLVGDDMPTAVLIVEAAGAARAVGERGVTLARTASGVGVLLALTGAPGRAAVQAMSAVTAAGVLALGYGAWSARHVMRTPLAPPPARFAWHAMPVPKVLAAVDSREAGLTEREAQHRLRAREIREIAGESVRAAVSPSLPRSILDELANPMTPALTVGAIGSAIVGSMVDAALVTLVMAASALVGGVQRLSADRTVAEMSARSALIVRVRRDGAERLADAVDLVRGDVIVLRAGDVVPADCRIITADGLEADESALTGESLPVGKTSDPVLAQDIGERRSMLYEGTTIAVGEAVAVVVATGDSTEIGRAMAAVWGKAPESGVEARLARITKATTPVAFGAALGVAVSGLVRGHPLRGVLADGINLAVAAVPEGLPLLVGAAQLAATRRLAARGVQARNPRTIEALGRVNVLCFDKTGTLTEGEIRLTRVADRRHDRSLDRLDRGLRRVLRVALRATPDRPDGDHSHLTDAAVAEGAARAGVGRGPWRRVAELPFEPSRGYHASLGKERGELVVSVKGAPEVVLPRCRGGADAGELIERLAAAGHRVLAVAERRMPLGGEPGGDAVLADGGLEDLTFLGLLGLADVVRATAAPAIARLHDAGVQIIMLTGDHPSTAGTIAADVLGTRSGHHIMTGGEIDDLTDDELDAALPGVDVVARCTPSNKVRVVESFRRLGRVVAMTGDGANDAAGIRLADVGIALGGGTPAAQAAADLVVTDDRLETIISALVEGRAMWASVREALAILVGGNLGEIGFTLLGSLLTGRSPLSARQLLLVNMLTDLAPALAIAVREPSEDAATSLLGEGPESSLGAALTRDITERAAVTALGAGLGWLAARLTGPAARARTTGLVALVGTQLAQTLIAGGLDRTVLLSGLGSAAALALVVQTPGVSGLFGCVPLDPFAWGIALGAIALAVAAGRLLPVPAPPAADPPPAAAPPVAGE